ncbi:hypothetical protein FQZ97_950410 [compost metagenome]
MTHSLFAADGRRFTAWVAILGTVLGWTNVGLYVAATGGDLTVTMRPEVFLALPVAAHTLFYSAMVLDTLGYYLAYLAIGGYLWSRLRSEHGAVMDMAVLCVVVYVILGVAGASIQFAAIGPLAAVHAAGDAAAKAASESAWLAIAQSAQNGLWLMEGPVMGFWGLVVGYAMRASGMAYGRLLMAAGAAYAGVFIAGVLGLAELATLVQLIAIFLLPLWALLSGIHMLRQRGERLVAANQ